MKVRKPKNDLERNLKISIIFPSPFCLVLLVVMMVIWVQKVSERGSWTVAGHLGVLCYEAGPSPTPIYYSKRDLKCIPLRWLSCEYYEILPLFLSPTFWSVTF